MKRAWMCVNKGWILFIYFDPIYKAGLPKRIPFQFLMYQICAWVNWNAPSIKMIIQVAMKNEDFVWSPSICTLSSRDVWDSNPVNVQLGPSPPGWDLSPLTSSSRCRMMNSQNFSRKHLRNRWAMDWWWVKWTYTAAGSKSVLAAPFLTDEKKKWSEQKFYVCFPPWLLRYFNECDTERKEKV